MNITTITTLKGTEISFSNSQIESMVKTDSNIIIRFNTGTIFNISTIYSDEANNYFKISKEMFDRL
jgi:hypothetical protein